MANSRPWLCLCYTLMLAASTAAAGKTRQAATGTAVGYMNSYSWPTGHFTVLAASGSSRGPSSQQPPGRTLHWLERRNISTKAARRHGRELVTTAAPARCLVHHQGFATQCATYALKPIWLLYQNSHTAVFAALSSSL